MRKNIITRKKKIKLNAKENVAVNLFKCINHYCPDLLKWLRNIEDPRHTSYTTYETDELTFLTVLKKICRCGTMRQMPYS